MNVTNRKRNKKKRKEIKSTAGQCETSSTSNEQGESSGTSSMLDKITRILANTMQQTVQFRCISKFSVSRL